MATEDSQIPGGGVFGGPEEGGMRPGSQAAGEGSRSVSFAWLLAAGATGGGRRPPACLCLASGSLPTPVEGWGLGKGLQAHESCQSQEQLAGGVMLGRRTAGEMRRSFPSCGWLWRSSPSSLLGARLQGELGEPWNSCASPEDRTDQAPGGERAAWGVALAGHWAQDPSPHLQGCLSQALATHPQPGPFLS